MTLQLTSVFSGCAYSFSGRTTKGDQSRTGPLRLNYRYRTFVHFNFGLILDRFEEEIHYLLETERRDSLLKSVKNSFNQENIIVEPLPEEQENEPPGFQRPLLQLGISGELF